MHKNFAEYIILKSVDFPNKIAIVDSRSSVNYKNLAQYVRRYSYYLKNSGTRPGDPVIILMDDSIEWIVSFLSLVYIGANPVLLSHLLPLTKVQKLIKEINAKRIITCNDKVLLDCGIEETQAHQFGSDEICLWATSSGTTGNIKFILHKHSNLEILSNIACPALEITEDSRIYTMPKLSFVYGLNCSVTFALGQGATVIVSNQSPKSEVIYSIVKKYNPTHFFATPGIFSSLTNQEKSPTDILKGLTLVASAGESLPAIVKEKFYNIYGVYIREGYGTAESLSWVTIQTKEDEHNHNIGKPLTSILCEVRNSQNEICKIGELGRLCINTPCSATMYYNDSVQTNQTFLNGWILTNDLVYTNNDNNLVFVCRSDEQTKINGNFVSLLEIENSILQISGVSDCVATVQKNNNGLNVLATFIVGSVTAKDIRASLREKLERHKIPKIIKFVDRIPKTINNKKIRNI